MWRITNVVAASTPPPATPPSRPPGARAAAGPDAPEAALVDAVDVDVHRGGFGHGPAVPPGPHDRAVRPHPAGADLANRRRRGQPAGQNLGEPVLAAVRAQREHASRREQRRREARRRCGVERAARGGEGAPDAVAVILRGQPPPPPRRLEATRGLPLEPPDPAETP